MPWFLVLSCVWVSITDDAHLITDFDCSPLLTKPLSVRQHKCVLCPFTQLQTQMLGALDAHLVQFLPPVLGNSMLPATPALGDLTPSSSPHRHRTHVYNPTHSWMHTIKNKTETSQNECRSGMSSLYSCLALRPPSKSAHPSFSIELWELREPSIPGQACASQGADARQGGAMWEPQSCKCRVISAVLHLLQLYAVCSFNLIGSRQSIKCVLDIKDGESLGNEPSCQ